MTELNAHAKAIADGTYIHDPDKIISVPLKNGAGTVDVDVRYKRYPSDFKDDLNLARACDVGIVFAPSVGEMYHEESPRHGSSPARSPASSKAPPDPVISLASRQL